MNSQQLEKMDNHSTMKIRWNLPLNPWTNSEQTCGPTEHRMHINAFFPLLAITPSTNSFMPASSRTHPHMKEFIKGVEKAINRKMVQETQQL